MTKLGTIFFGVFAVLCLWAHYKSPSLAQKAISQIFNSGMLISDKRDEVKTILESLLSETRYKNQIVINSAPELKHVNVYLVDLKKAKTTDIQLSRLFESIEDNCVSFSQQEIIICDNSFLRNAFLKQNFVSDRIQSASNSKQLNQQHVHTFMTWVLAHELGHVLNADSMSFYHSSQFVNDVKSISISYQNEILADEVAYELIAREKHTAIQVETLLIEILNNELKKKLGSENIPYGVGILFDYTGQHKPSFFCSGSHPEYLIRTIRLLHIAGKREEKGWLRKTTSELIGQLKAKNCEKLEHGTK